MHNLKDIYSLLAATGIPTVYRAWPVGSAPDFPFICYLETGTNNFMADNKVYQKITDLDIELYTREKDPATEALVEQALAEIPWDKTEVYIDSERCYEIVYSIEI